MFNWFAKKPKEKKSLSPTSKSHERADWRRKPATELWCPKAEYSDEAYHSPVCMKTEDVGEELIRDWVCSKCEYVYLGIKKAKDREKELREIYIANINTPAMSAKETGSSPFCAACREAGGIITKCTNCNTTTHDSCIFELCGGICPTIGCEEPL